MIQGASARVCLHSGTTGAWSRLSSMSSMMGPQVPAPLVGPTAVGDLTCLLLHAHLPDRFSATLSNATFMTCTARRGWRRASRCGAVARVVHRQRTHTPSPRAFVPLLRAKADLLACACWPRIRCAVQPQPLPGFAVQSPACRMCRPAEARRATPARSGSGRVLFPS